MTITTLLKLYDAPIDQAPRLAESKYGVRHFCPDQGAYGWDDRHDQVQCSIHGDRQHSRQDLRLAERSSFASFVKSLDEVVLRLRFQDEALMATVEIARRP